MVLQQTFNLAAAEWQVLPQAWRRWLPLNSSCLEENIAIVTGLCFLAFMLLHLAYNLLISISRHGAKTRAKQSLESNKMDVALGISYKCSAACTSMVTGTHLLLIWMSLNGKSSRCESFPQAFLSEVMQAALGIIALFMLYKTMKKQHLKFPCMLRSWWICSFFLSVLSVALDIDYAIKKTKQDVPVRVFTDLLRLLGSSCLFGISLYGKTGMVLSDSNGTMTEPLLQDDFDPRDSELGRAPLYEKANLLQVISFSWLNPLFALGNKKPLESHQVPDISAKESARYISLSFEECLRATHPSFYKAIFLFIKRKAMINILFAIISTGASFLGPYLINDFVSFLSDKEAQNRGRGYLLMLGFLGANLIQTIAETQSSFGIVQLEVRMRAALISCIYNKGLVLSSQSRQTRTMGELINYVSVDAEKLVGLVWYLNRIWMLPIEISLAVYIMRENVGIPGSVAALIATFSVMAWNMPITKFQEKFQDKVMEAKDLRMKSTSEVLRNIKTIKFHGWDDLYQRKLKGLRSTEYEWLWRSRKLSAFASFLFWSSTMFISTITFGACLIFGVQLTTGRVLSALATLRMLQNPIFSLPDFLTFMAQAKVSADRLSSFLQDDEIQREAVEIIPRDQATYDVEINGGRFAWNQETSCPTLDAIELKVKKGMKVAICGVVGSGKSSLLASILGEMQKLFGHVMIGGKKAYVPQTPWILSGTIKKNIIFGNSYNTEMYDKTVKACALMKDLELLPAGDQTEIGERGINLSGGQKQRIQLARAVYQDADIYLLDDPFSAVDAHTGSQLFQECLMGVLKEKTVLFVTHQVEFLPAADLVIVMRDGRIEQLGTFEEIMKENSGFEVLVGAHSLAIKSLCTVDSSNSASQDPADRKSYEKLLLNEDISSEKDEPEIEEISEDKGKLVLDEEREYGRVGFKVYWSYITLVNYGILVPFILLAQSLQKILLIGSDYWIVWASSATSGTVPRLSTVFVISGYIILGLGCSVCALVRAILVGLAALWTAQGLFKNMLHSIMRAPMSFFDSTPTARIINRATTDQTVLDQEIAGLLAWFTYFIINILGTIAVMSQAAWPVIILFIPITAICIWYQQYYISSGRELSRICGTQRAPILHHFQESLAGSATIRAFDQEQRFIDENLDLIDNYSGSRFYSASAMSWFSFRLDLLSNSLFAVSLLLLVNLPEGAVDPSIAGLAVSYGMNLNYALGAVLWYATQIENKIISVERVLQYSSLPSEAALLIEETRPSSSWPESGTVCFKNLEIGYAEHLPPVLKDINCTFPGKKKIGIVGRTGSGKSTLMQAVFRIVEPRKGTILIDEVDICTIGLHDLRSRLSIIPQEPTLFEGTIRGNLDPLEQYLDNEIWEALDKCQLGELVRAKEEQLDSPGLSVIVAENGENWSVGQRQLLCLGRALLKRSGILVLDEATASIDSATDRVVQEVIRREFVDCTVITIAHRINTVIDNDLILVLTDGRVVEYDSPSELLERDDSLFLKLIREYSMRSQQFNSLAHRQG